MCLKIKQKKINLKLISEDNTIDTPLQISPLVFQRKVPGNFRHQGNLSEIKHRNRYPLFFPRTCKGLNIELIHHTIFRTNRKGTMKRRRTILPGCKYMCITGSFLKQNKHPQIFFACGEQDQKKVQKMYGTSSLLKFQKCAQLAAF